MTFGLLTNIGRNKEAAALAGGTAFTITEIAWGDGPRVPAGGEVALENEQGRKPVQSSGTVADTPNTAFFEILLEEAEGPFVIREVGLFDAEGDMVAVAHYDPPINKPLNHVSAVLGATVLFSDLENLVLQVQSTNLFASAERQIASGDGLTGGGDLSADRTLSLDFASEAEVLAGTEPAKPVAPNTLAARITALIGGAPGNLNTLDGLAQAVQDNDSEIAAILTALADKLDASAAADFLSTGDFGLGETGPLLTDLDDFAGSGFARFDTTTANHPPGVTSGLVIALKYETATRGTQLVIARTPSDMAGRVLTRSFVSPAWSDWVPLATQDDAGASMELIYDGAVDGSVAWIETPVFEDGFEYALVLNELGPNSGYSTLKYEMQDLEGNWKAASSHAPPGHDLTYSGLISFPGCRIADVGLRSRSELTDVTDTVVDVMHAGTISATQYWTRPIATKLKSVRLLTDYAPNPNLAQGKVWLRKSRMMEVS